MYTNIIYLRNCITRFLYKNLAKPIFFRFDPEIVHDRMINIGRFLGKHNITRKITSIVYSYSNKKLEQTILDIKFPNPIGLSAGFDKDAILTDIISSVGFGFVEVGSITGEPCEGNPKPRLWRLKKSKSLVVYYGLKNEGSEAVAKKMKGRKFPLPVGISIAKTNSRETVADDSAIADYFKTYREFAGIGDYATINISCPNAFGGQPFTNSKELDRLLT